MDGVLPVPAALGGDFVPLELSHGSEHSSGYLQPSAEALSFDGAADEPPRAVTPPRTTTQQKHCIEENRGVTKLAEDYFLNTNCTFVRKREKSVLYR